MRILFLNGPNLNLLGTRQPELYGTTTLEQIEQGLREAFPEVAFDFIHSNHEGTLVDAVQAWRSYEAIILNPGAYAHTSIALLDALLAAQLPKAEVHLTNIHAREDFRQRLLTARGVHCVLSGLGPLGYHLAVRWALAEVRHTGASVSR
jgi:3-dehydroquinate dehydratase-2